MDKRTFKICGAVIIRMMDFVACEIEKESK